MAIILLIDDDSQLRGMLKQMLERDSHSVIEAEDGEAGVKIAKDKGIDLIISDLIMPGKDGIMAIQEMLQKNPKVRIIAMSGGATGNAAWSPIATKAGAFRVLKKPFAQKQLIETVNEALQAEW